MSEGPKSFYCDCSDLSLKTKAKYSGTNCEVYERELSEISAKVEEFIQAKISNTGAATDLFSEFKALRDEIEGNKDYDKFR